MDQAAKEKYAKLFFIGALWNVFFAGLALLVPKLGRLLIFGFKKTATSAAVDLFYKISWALILVYGVGYYMVSRDPEKNRGVVWMGILGKLGFFFAVLQYYLKKTVTIVMMLGAFGDFVFSMLYSTFLFKTRNNA
jgi:hypothetical protein